MLLRVAVRLIQSTRYLVASLGSRKNCLSCVRTASCLLSTMKGVRSVEPFCRVEFTTRYSRQGTDRRNHSPNLILRSLPDVSGTIGQETLEGLEQIFLSHKHIHAWLLVILISIHHHVSCSINAYVILWSTKVYKDSVYLGSTASCVMLCSRKILCMIGGYLSGPSPVDVLLFPRDGYSNDCCMSR